jgi:predicted Zn finger-like uncharacterized protein
MRFQRVSNDNTMSTRQFKASCPLCGARLRIEHDDIDLKANERVRCPVHGDMGSLEEGRQFINRNYIADSAKKVVRAIMKRTGADPSAPALGWPHSN